MHLVKIRKYTPARLLPSISFDISILKVHNILASDAIKAFPLDPGETLSFEDGSSIIVARMSKARLAQLKTLIAAVDYSRK